MRRSYSYYLIIALVARGASAQWWNNHGGWPSFGGNSCPALKGCRLSGNNRYLGNRETVGAGTYTMECDVDGGSSIDVDFLYNGASSRDSFSPYRKGNIRVTCESGSSVQVIVTGKTRSFFNSRQCFQRVYTLSAGSCNQCNYRCPQNSRQIRNCPQSFRDCQCNPGFLSNGSFCAQDCFRCPPNSVARRTCPRSFEDCQCDRGTRRDWGSRMCIVSGPTLGPPPPPPPGGSPSFGGQPVVRPSFGGGPPPPPPPPPPPGNQPTIGGQPNFGIGGQPVVRPTFGGNFFVPPPPPPPPPGPMIGGQPNFGFGGQPVVQPTFGGGFFFFPPPAPTPPGGGFQPALASSFSGFSPWFRNSPEHP